MEQIRRELAGTVHAEMDGKEATVSIGLRSHSRAITKERILYAAKRSGKNKTVSDSHPRLSV